MANTGSDNVSILLGVGNGTFQAAVDYATDIGPFSVSAGDWDGDGDADLAVANPIGEHVSIHLGAGNGTFQAAVNYVAGTSPRGLTVADWNGDGKPDLGVANTNTPPAGDTVISILLGVGDGTFQPPDDYGDGFSTAAYAVTTGDWNGDGKPDLALVNASASKLSVLLHQ